MLQRYVIERDLPGAADLTPATLKEIATKSNDVLRGIPNIQWEHSYVAGDRIYCVYLAESADQIREHARQGGFPCDKVTPVATVIDPLTQFS